MSVEPLQLSTAPYPGLRPFRSNETDIFFGRERHTDVLLKKLSEHRFLAVIGPSGCGKSSLVKAGLLPSLETGFIAHAGSHWRTASMRPGQHPMRNLAEALLACGIVDSERAVQPDASVFLEAALRRGPLGLIEVVRQSSLEPDANLIVLVDQFEELFRFSNVQHTEEADAFVALLLESTAAKRERIYVAITMRSDFLAECATFYGLPEAINEGLFLTPRLTRDECSACIASPARVFGGAVSPELVNRLLNEFGPAPDQLPLLQHALLQMWDRRTVNGSTTTKVVLDTADYDSIGGISRALSDHAETVLAELDPAGRRVAEVVFRCLADTDAEKRDRRRPTTIAEIAVRGSVPVPDIVRVADAFRRRGRCFLTPAEDVPLTPDTVLDISHESLLRQWPTLASWILDESERAATYRKLVGAAADWRHNRGPLWDSQMLNHALAWRDRIPTAAWARRYSTADDFANTMAFLDASVEALRRAQERRTRPLRVVLKLSASLAVIMALTIPVYDLLFVWDYTADYRSFVRVYGEPRGIGELNEDARSHRALSYRIIRAGRLGHAKRMSAINSSGALAAVAPDYDAAESMERKTSEWVYEYDANGAVTAELQYTRDHKHVQGKVYISQNNDHPHTRSAYFLGADGIPTFVTGSSEHSDSFCVETIEYSTEGLEQTLRYLGRNGERVPGPDHAYGQRRSYDGAGNIVVRLSLDAEDNPMNDAYGNASAVSTYDSDSNQTELRALDANGKLTLVIDGFSSLRAQFDVHGNMLKLRYFDDQGAAVAARDGWQQAQYIYDSRGHLLKENYLDPGGVPTMDRDNRCYGAAFEYDEKDRLSKRTCLDEKGQPMASSDGSTSVTTRYDDDDRVIEQSYFDSSGRSARTINGHATLRNHYDARGRVDEITYEDVDHQRTITKDGNTGIVKIYDDQLHQRITTYVGLHREPVALEGGYASEKAILDNFGRTTEIHYLGIDGTPATSTSGHVGLRHRLDDYGHIIETYYLGINGDIVFSKDSYAGWRFQLDALGRQKNVTYLGLHGEPIASRGQGIVSWASTFDNRGNEIQRTYLGYDNKPTVTAQGEAGWLATYDNNNHQTTVTYIDTSGARTLHSWNDDNFTGSGYARREFRYNAIGLLTEEVYYDSSLQRTLSPAGWSRVIHQRDRRGNESQISYLGINDESDKPRTSQAHAVACEHNDLGQEIECRYYNLGDRLTGMSKYYVRIVNKYDRFGELADEEVFDNRGNASITPGGVHRMIIARDDQGRVTKEEMFGTGGPLDKRQRTEYSYDILGNQIEERHLDPTGSDGKLIATRAQPCAVIAQSWTTQSQDRRCLDSERKPTNGLPSGYARELSTWERPGLVSSIKYFASSGGSIRKDFAEIRDKYDALGRRIEEIHLDESEHLAKSSSNPARVTWSYDAMSGNLIEEAEFEADGQPSHPVAKTLMRYDSLHRKTQEIYLGPNEARAALLGTGQHVTLYTYDPYGNLQYIKYLDKLLRPTPGYARDFDKTNQKCWRWSPGHDDDGNPIGPGRCEHEASAPVAKDTSAK